MRKQAEQRNQVFTLFPLISRYFILFPPIFYFLRKVDERQAASSRIGGNTSGAP